jgi:hypothetical protein
VIIVKTTITGLDIRQKGQPEMAFSPAGIYKSDWQATPPSV